MNEQQVSADSDITILGGGLAGLSLALQCRQHIPGARIWVIEKNAHPVPEAAFKVGESTVEVGSTYFAKVLGLEQHIVEEQLPKLGLRFFFGADDNRVIERRLELGGQKFAPVPSYQLDRGRFENFLGEQCRSRDIMFVDRAKVQQVELGRGRAPHEIRYERNGQTHVIKTRWMADASGRAGLLKRKLGLERSSPHKANAAWFRVQARIKIDDWSDDPTWHEGHDDANARWYSTNHLMGKGYWVWLIPLSSGSTSVGIVADEETHPLTSFNSLEKSLQWLERYEPQCGEKIREHEDKIQDFLAIKRYSMECTQVFSAHRWGITGEAGFFLDPFYSPGSDFIAFGNTFLSDLMRRELAGKNVRFRAFLYERIFKSFFYGTAQAYQDQYQIFGNHQVMPVKIMWDYLVYWSLTGYIFMHDRLCDQLMYPRNMFKLRMLSRLNHFMQSFFRQWHQRSPGHEVNGVIRMANIPLIPEANERLLDELDKRAFNQRFSENVAQLETLFWEIIDHADLGVPVPFKRRRHTNAWQHTLQHVFEVTTHPAREGQIQQFKLQKPQMSS